MIQVKKLWMIEQKHHPRFYLHTYQEYQSDLLQFRREPLRFRVHFDI